MQENLEMGLISNMYELCRYSAVAALGVAKSIRPGPRSYMLSKS